MKKVRWISVNQIISVCHQDAFEINFSCPHGMPERKMGAAVGQDCGLLEEVCGWINEKATIPVWAKMTPNITDITQVRIRISFLGVITKKGSCICGLWLGFVIWFPDYLIYLFCCLASKGVSKIRMRRRCCYQHHHECHGDQSWYFKTRTMCWRVSSVIFFNIRGVLLHLVHVVLYWIRFICYKVPKFYMPLLTFFTIAWFLSHN